MPVVGVKCSEWLTTTPDPSEFAHNVARLRPDAWTFAIGASACSGRLSTAMAECNPMEALTAAIQDAYGADLRGPRTITAQITAPDLDCQPVEGYLVDGVDLDDASIEARRTELTRSARRLGATPWPSPPDPELVGAVVEQLYPDLGQAVPDPGGTEPEGMELA